MLCVTSPVHGLFPVGATKDQPVGKSTMRVSAVPTVTNFAVTVIGVALVPEVPISEVDVAVASVIVAALAEGETPAINTRQLVREMRVLKYVFMVVLKALFKK